ncbi:MAG TPA: fibronectin type III domain-containing protein [Syntrophales bacterium]|nr:fibronectin type III domain-containing protein [Syntrophales bacterium]
MHLLFFCSIALFSMASLVLFVFAGQAHCADVIVAWDANPEPAVRGYVIYYGTSPGNYTQSIDVGNSTSCAISGLQAGATYYMAVTAYDDSRNESGFSNEIVYAASTESSPASSSGNRCFIATAAFGSPMAPEVALLRAFRDSYLLTNGPGRIVVDFYYRVSPPIADLISRDENLRQIARLALMPLIYCVKNTTAAIALLFLPPIFLILRKVDWKPRLIAVCRRVMSGRRV